MLLQEKMLKDDSAGQTKRGLAPEKSGLPANKIHMEPNILTAHKALFDFMVQIQKKSPDECRLRKRVWNGGDLNNARMYRLRSRDEATLSEYQKAGTD
jgi:hypothetical protein